MLKIIGNDRRVIARAGRPRDRRDEAISPSRECRDVSGVTLPIAQRLAQPIHVKAQAAFFHDDIGPDPRKQILLAHDFVRGGSQDDQYIVGTRAQFDGDPFLRKETLVHEQFKRAELQTAVGPFDSRRHGSLCDRTAQLALLTLRPFLQTIKGNAIERFRDDRALEFARSDKGLAAPNGR